MRPDDVVAKKIVFNYEEGLEELEFVARYRHLLPEVQDLIVSGERMQKIENDNKRFREALEKINHSKCGGIVPFDVVKCAYEALNPKDAS